MNIVLIGAPGSGKGTIGQMLEKNLNLKHLSSGQILRDMSKNNSKLKEFLSTGNLLDDKTMEELLKKRLLQDDCKNGVVLDGYPRTLPQAKGLQDFFKFDVILNLELPNEEIINRLANRLTCPKCKKVYNKLTYKKTICEDCGEKLVARTDDNEETILKRIEIFNKETKPILDMFPEKIVNVLSVGNPQDVYNRAEKLLKKEVQKIGCENSRRN